MKQLGIGLWLAVPVSLMIGCATPDSRTPADSAKESSAFAPPTQLTATMTNGDSVILHWKNNSTAEGGNWVEFATPGSEFTKLTAFPSDAPNTSFIHPRVAPLTTFIYRVEPYFGRASRPVEITTGVPTNNAPVLGEGPIASPGASVSGENGPKLPLRTLQTFARAAPTDLTATLSSPTSVDLRWKDRASDEDGYFLEIGRRATGPFRLCALLPPDTSSFRIIHLPPATKCYFRVRAYFYGKPSDTASVNTQPR
jgi:hypothetical protein